MMKVFFTLLALVGLVVAAEAAATMPHQFQITIENASPYFLPATATVARGAGIQWSNPTATYHTITSDGCRNGGRCLFDSGSIPPDGTYTLPGLPPGRYSYHCTLHPIMRGVIEVVDRFELPGLN
jgi:plastocyanin